MIHESLYTTMRHRGQDYEILLKVAPEPPSGAYAASYRNTANVQLARALHAVFWRGATYDRMAAHRWVLRLLHAAPANGAELKACLLNYDYMIEPAMRSYYDHTDNRKMYDEAYDVYLAWCHEHHGQPVNAAGQCYPAQRTLYNVSYAMSPQDNGHCVTYTDKRQAEQCVSELRRDGAYSVQLWTA